MNQYMSIAEKLTYATVLIKCTYANGQTGSGTGFIINLCKDVQANRCIPVIITNKHVIENSTETVFEFCKADANGLPIDTQTVGVRYGGNGWIPHPDSSVDLCCLLLAEALSTFEQANVKVFYIPLAPTLIPNCNQISDLSAMEDILMLGYPIGLSDTYNHKPILRKGITATHIKKDYQGKKEFLVDMACFPGSSGSPIFILNEGTYTTSTGVCVGSRLYLVGVLYGGPQYNAQGILTFANLPNIPHPVTRIPTNLGVAIKAERILEFESILAE